MYIFIAFAVSFLTTFFVIRTLAPQLSRKEIIGRDMNKPSHPKIPEMGGLAIVAGLGAGVLMSIGLKTFVGVLQAVDSTSILMALLTIFILGFLGTLDDLIKVSQSVKTVTPLFAAIPLMVNGYKSWTCFNENSLVRLGEFGDLLSTCFSTFWNYWVS